MKVQRLRLLPAVAVLVASLGGCSGEESAPESSAADAPARSTTTTAPPPPTLQRVVAEPGVLGGDGDQRLAAVAAGFGRGVGGRLVAVGSSAGAPAVWSSLDGSEWIRAVLPADQFGPGATLADVAPNPAGGGWAAVGGEDGQAAAWVSTDGEQWRRAVIDGGPPMTKVGATSLGLVAFGGGDGGATAWISTFGDRWMQAVEAPAVFDRPGAARVVAVADAGPEAQAVVQREGSGPEIWRSDDGVRWSATASGEGGPLPATGAPEAAAATSLGSALVVVGSDAKADGVDGGMWLSTDARTFEQVPHDERTMGGDGAQAMTGVVPVGDRLVVVGSETDESGDLDAVVWGSAMGSGVERAGGDGVPVPGNQHVVDVAVLGATPVAVGWEETPAGIDAVAWVVRSEPVPEEGSATEGPAGPALVWHRVAGQDALSGPGEQRVEAVVAGPSGWVAAGSVTGDEGNDGAVWSSPDGWAWSRAGDQALGGPGDQGLLDVAAGPSGLAAVGSDGESPAVWISVDGASWERAPADPTVFGPGQGVRAVTALPGGPGWVAVGTDVAGGSADPAVWLSAEGRAWQRVPAGGALGGLGDQELSDVAAGPSGIVAVGTDGGSAGAWTSADGVSWAKVDLGPGRATGVGMDGAGTFLAVGSTGGDGLDPVAWRSVDGAVWERVEGDGLSEPLDQELTAVAMGEGMAVAVGRSNLGGGDDAAAWGSSDGAGWVRSPHDEEVLGGDAAQVMAGVAVAAGAPAVAVGWSGSAPESRDAAVWVTDLQGGGARSRL